MPESAANGKSPAPGESRRVNHPVPAGSTSDDLIATPPPESRVPPESHPDRTTIIFTDR